MAYEFLQEALTNTMEYLMTFDVGTTAIKTCLFTKDFYMTAFASEEYELLTPDKDIVELDPNTYWRGMKSGTERVLAASGIRPEDIKVITVTTQGETLIPVNKNGEVLHNAVVWLDARAVEETAIIAEAIDRDEIYRTTGLSDVNPAWPLCKVFWFKRHRPALFEKTHKFLLLEDYLLYKLTGEFVTEHAILSSTGYFDINNNTFWNTALETIGVDKNIFPKILPCGACVGKVTPAAAEYLGLSTETAVSTGAMDQVCSAIGAGNVKPGIVSETTGTALVIAATIAKPNYENPAKINILKHFDDNFLILPYCPTAGMVLKWFKDEFFTEESRDCREKNVSIYQLLDSIAEAVKPGSDGLVILPHFAGMLTPEMNSDAKGVFFGVTLATKKGHFVRAILEAIGYMLRENIELLENMNLEVEEVRSIGGGASSRLWNSIKADITGKSITTLEQLESTSLGAAILGALSIGMVENMEEVQKNFIKKKESFSPETKNIAVYNKNFKVYTKLYERVKSLF